MPPVHRLDAGSRELVLERLSQALAGREHILFASVHGSFLEARGFRDIDLAIWTAPGSGARLDLELAIELSQVAGYPLDVRIVNQAPVSFLFHVLRGRIVLVRDERWLADLMERTARAYHDLAPLLRRATREAFA